MSAPTCATCKWHSEPAERDTTVRDLAASMFTAADDERDYWATDTWTDEEKARAARVRVCTSPRLRFYEFPQQGEATVLDGSQYRGILATDRDFGCTNHEARDQGQTG